MGLRTDYDVIFTSITDEDLEYMDYKDVAAHISFKLEALGYECPCGYNTPRKFNEWLRDELGADKR